MLRMDIWITGEHYAQIAIEKQKRAPGILNTMRYLEYIKRYFLIDEPKSGRLISFVPRPVQQKYYNELVRDYDIENRGLTNPVREIILKARKEGFTSLILALFAVDDLTSKNPTETLVISYKDTATEQFRKRYRNFILSTAARKLGYAIERIQQSPPVLEEVAKKVLSVDSAEFELKHNKAHFYCGTASARVGGRGGTVQKLLFCLSGETKIIKWDSSIVSIKDINAGEIIIDGKGRKVVVSNLSKRSLKKEERMLSINTYGESEPLVLTDDHKVLCRGSKKDGFKPTWKQAKKLTKKDYIAWPTREFRKTKNYLVVKNITEKGGQGNRETKRIVLNREFGEIIGWYLAEGIIKKHDGKPRAVGFCVNKKEIDYIKSLASNFTDFISSVNVSQRKNSQSAIVSFVGANFANFIEERFGKTDNKRIPPSVMKYGKEFCEGLIKGLVLGDGSLKQDNHISFTSTRVHLTYGLKRLLVDMRLGLASIYKVKGGFRNNRNNQDQYQLYLGGSGNIKVRKIIDVDYKKYNNCGFKRAEARGWNFAGWQRFRRGADYYWQKIRKIEEVKAEEFVYDIILEDEPHSFLTTNGVVHNSEAAFYPDKKELRAKEIIEGTANQMDKEAGWLFVESTANGDMNHYAKMWQSAESGQSRFKARFYGWREFYTEQQFEVIKSEFTDKRMIPQEYPENPHEAFLSSGDRFFDPTISVNIKTESPQQILGSWKYYGDFTPGHRYAGGADVSEGVGRHNSTAVIIDFDHKKVIEGRLFTKPRVVAIYANNKIAPDLFAHEIKNGGQGFGNCLIAPERNNHGFATLTVLKGIYFNIYKDEHEKLGWQTTLASKPKMMHDLRTAVHDDLIDIADEDLKREIISMPSADLNVAKVDEEDETAGHYDRVIALAIAWQMRSMATMTFNETVRDEEEEKSFNKYATFDNF